VAAARAGWEEAFARAGGEQALLLPDGMSSEFDAAEWTW
jgi:hypothetical protein